MADSKEPITANLTPLPDKVGVEGLESKWGKVWDDAQVYRFRNTRDRKSVYSIDTPPPTASGHLHVGHVFSYTHTDIIARYKRMRGFDVLYPMGWDDNGLPTERRVQNYYGVRVDTSLPYDPDFKPPFEGTEGKKIQAKDQVPCSRQNFIELCEKLTPQDEAQFEHLWRALGLSVDWNQTYNTIGIHARRVAQKAFLRNLARGEAYQKEAPGLWDVTFQTAVAQAELESREYDGFYHRVAFHFEDGTPIYIETTRPELLPACVALIAHPDDERYQKYFNTYVYSPIFNVKVPVLSHRAAEMDKGAGIAMCCTFGDVTDVEWWRDLNLPTRSIIEKNGRITSATPDWITDPEGRGLFEQIAGKTTFTARKIIAEALKESGDLDGEPRPTKRMTNFYEKGDKPLEIVTSRQWYLKNGGTDEDLRAALLERGKELNFHPDFMRVRYNNWVEGLKGDWLISRQRYFGIPFPLWYPVKADGTVDYAHPLTPSEKNLPIDPVSDVPEGYTAEQRDVPGGFTAEKDVMDTWATSSLTPQIVTHWGEEGEDGFFNASFPMDLRPQGQDIIRTWLFSTICRAHLENGVLPWKNATLSGWILDPDHKKMSKSKGNVVVPTEPIQKQGADAVRYWAASARLGVDAAYDEGQMKIGRRLAIKLLNATKFALAIGREDENHQVTEPAQAIWDPANVTNALDRSLMAVMAHVIRSATADLENYDHAKALADIETFFWQFCDDYIELVKNRAYGTAPATGTAPSPEDVLSARTTLGIALDAFARLFAPYMPYVTEEMWSWMHAEGGSVHRASWPDAAYYDACARGADPERLDWVSRTLIALRKIKSVARVSMKTPILKAEINVDRAGAGYVKSALADIAEAGRVTGKITVNAVNHANDANDNQDTGIKITSFQLGEPPAKPAKDTEDAAAQSAGNSNAAVDSAKAEVTPTEE